MSPEEFFEKFETFAEVPQAITKLRGLILRLAFQGCLSEFSSDDEPIASLLTQVENDRKKSRGKSLDPVRPDEVDCSIPSRWRWVRFGEVAKHNAGKTLDKKRNTGTPRDYITTSNLYWGRFELDQLRQMLIKDEEMERCTAQKGDLLICEGGDAGRAAVWPYEKEVSFQNHVHRARFFAEINPYFVYRYFEKLNATGEINQFRKGVGISSMSGKALASIPVPLPPLAEQKRIVAKVDALMGWCDRLEALQAQRDTQHAALARAALARFADNPTPQTLQALFHDQFPINPNDLRKSILTMAVRGKLTTQNVDEAKPEIDEFDSLYEIPCNWTWTQVNEIGFVYTGRTPPTREAANYGGEIPFIGPGQITSDGEIIQAEKWLTEQGLEAGIEAKAEDLLMVCIGGSIGKTTQCRSRLSFNQQINALRPKRAISEYALIVLRSDYFQEQVLSKASGSATPIINRGKWGSLPFVLPPLAEQRRIVAKVDELMALVDRLDEHQRQAHDLGTRLLTAAVHELTKP